MGIKIENLCVTYNDSDTEALNNITLDVKDGEFLCLIGPSGCGKSTLLNIIAGLEKPTSGRVLLDSNEIKGPGADRVVMFQESALFPWLNVIENVKFGMKIAKIPKQEQEERAKKYLDMVHLYKFRNYNVHQLSGGMKQRAALARALTLDSKVLLMDEPFAALDKQTKNILRDEIQTIWMETKKTVIFITHSVEEAIFFGDRVVMLSANPGRIKEIYSIDLPRPRDISSPEFLQHRKNMLNQLRIEVERVAKEETDI